MSSKGICATVANPNSSPTAVSTEPSMMPCGGSQNPVAHNAIETARQTQNIICGNDKRFIYLVLSYCSLYFKALRRFIHPL